MHLCPCLAHLHEVKSWPFRPSTLRPLRGGLLSYLPPPPQPLPSGHSPHLPPKESCQGRQCSPGPSPLDNLLSSQPSPQQDRDAHRCLRTLSRTRPPLRRLLSSFFLLTRLALGASSAGPRLGPFPGQPCPHPTAGPSQAAEVTVSPSPGSLSAPQSREPRAARRFQRPRRVHMRTPVEAPGHPPVVPSVPQRKPSGKKPGPRPHTSTVSGHKANSWDTAQKGAVLGAVSPPPQSRSFLGPEAVTDRKQGRCRYVRCGRSGGGGGGW